VDVRLFGALRHVAGHASCLVEVGSGDTVQNVLDTLAIQCPELGAKVLSPDGRIQDGINVLVNGRDIRHLGGPDTPVHEGDRVALFPAVGGG
jgi:molybdopterin synthase sulfur carrier subunit